MIDQRRLLRDAFGTFMTGVTVVTTLDARGKPLGFTANSFSSVSLEPPLLLVSIARSSRNYAAFHDARGFAVNVLSECQKEVSNTFARPVPDRFATVSWRHGPHGFPVLEGVSAWFDCSMHQVVEAGDHAILLGHVEAFEAGSLPGLGYYRGGYFTPVRTADAIGTGPAVLVIAIIEKAGQVLLVDDGQGGLVLPSSRVGSEGASATLRALIASTGIAAEPGLIYAVYEDVRRGLQHLAYLCPATRGRPVRGAGFVDLSPAGLADVSDPAMRSMLERLSEENRLGNHGIYSGNQDAGEVYRLTRGSRP